MCNVPLITERSFWRRSFQPVTCVGTEETEPNASVKLKTQKHKINGNQSHCWFEHSAYCCNPGAGPARDITCCMGASHFRPRPVYDCAYLTSLNSKFQPRHGQPHVNDRCGHSHTTFRSTMDTDGFGHNTFCTMLFSV